MSARAAGIATSIPGRDHGCDDPELRSGSYFPDWLLERRPRAEGCADQRGGDLLSAWVSTRPTERLVESLGINRLSRSQVGEMARDLDEQVEAFRTRPPDALYLLRRGRAGPEGPRGRPGRERACSAGGRGQR
jgi:hypothetical protein